MRVQFPSGFIWGAATAAYQIEGAVDEDGRGPSIWDTFSHQPGTTRNGDTGDVATDHYHRMPADVAVMADLGLRAYRFSIAWPRVMPSGAGAVNQAGLDFYSRLVDELLSRDIEPFATLYHWDLPQSLEDAGGWTNRETAARFGDYAGVVGAALGDRVRRFTTLNEPWCSAFLGYATGVHAPGRTDLVSSLRAAHHLNLAHGLGAAALRAAAPDAQVSVTLNLAQLRPASDSAADIDATRSADALANRIFLEPILNGRYPSRPDRGHRPISPTGRSSRRVTSSAIAARPDFLGVNFYTPELIAAAPPPHERPTGLNAHDPDAAGQPSMWPGSQSAWALPQDGPFTAMGWRIEPGAFTELLLRVARDYPGLPMVITENGAAFDDVVGADGTVHDTDRIDYIDAHLRALHDAIEAGADVRGYFAWSLMDNFEWAWGYEKRFGIVAVDYATMSRTPKDSARWYQSVIEHNGPPTAVGQPDYQAFESAPPPLGWMCRIRSSAVALAPAGAGATPVFAVANQSEPSGSATTVISRPYLSVRDGVIVPIVATGPEALVRVVIDPEYSDPPARLVTNNAPPVTLQPAAVAALPVAVAGRVPIAATPAAAAAGQP